MAHTPAPNKARITVKVRVTAANTISARAISRNRSANRSCALDAEAVISTKMRTATTTMRGQSAGDPHQFAAKTPKIAVTRMSQVELIIASKLAARAAALLGRTSSMSESIAAPG